MNSINITGNIGNDLELRITTSGKRVLNISLAVRDRFNKEVTHWFPLVCWAANAEYLAKYAVKGSKIAVTGSLAQRKYTDRNGNAQSVVEIIADHAEIISGGKPKDKSTPQPEDFPEPPDDADAPGDLPF